MIFADSVNFNTDLVIARIDVLSSPNYEYAVENFDYVVTKGIINASIFGLDIDYFYTNEHEYHFHLGIVPKIAGTYKTGLATSTIGNEVELGDKCEEDFTAIYLMNDGQYDNFYIVQQSAYGQAYSLNYETGFIHDGGYAFVVIE